MRFVLILISSALIACLAGSVSAGGIGDAVEIEVLSDQHGPLPVYPVSMNSPGRKAYTEAVKGDRYSIVVRNRLNRRVGVVIAVDGRNIISGGKSYLANTERMYVLDPHGVGSFQGWRTGINTVHRFYFTSVADSYAAAFGDESAMGVIAVAVYPEIVRVEPEADVTRTPAPGRLEDRKGAPSARAEAEQPGTGFGSREYSPVRVVSFTPEATPAEKIFLKYEWRSMLCSRGIVACSNDSPPRNRMWDEEGFAPHPPGR